MNEDSIKIAREYMDSLLVESRIIGATRPSSKITFCGFEFDTPIVTAASRQALMLSKHWPWVRIW